MNSLILNNDLILSIVTGSTSLKVVEEALPYITKGKIFVDMNTVSARTKIRMGEWVEKRGGSFIEATILGTIASYGFRSPILVCGKRAGEFAAFLNDLGFDVKFLSETIGKASNLKMLRSVFAKGVESLLIEMLIAAKRCDMMEMVMDEIVEHMDKKSFLDIANTWITSNIIHAGRRTEEMDHVIETLNELKVTPVMASATRERLRISSNLHLLGRFKGKIPTLYHEVIEAMDKFSTN